MKKIRSRGNFIKITKTISLSLIMFITNISCTMQTSEKLQTTVHTLTQESYNNSELQNSILFLMNDSLLDNTTHEIPSIDKIIARISHLQNPQGIIKNEKTKTIALNALNAALQATNNALLIANSQEKKEALKHIIPSAHYHELINLLHNQKKLLQKKVDELNKKTIWSYIAKPSTPYIAAGITIALLATGIGAAYYYGYFNSYDSSQPIVFTGAPLSKKRKAAYEAVQHLLIKYHDPKDKDPLSNYMKPIAYLKNEFDPVADKKMIDALDTVIEAEMRQEICLQNIPFWVNIYLKQNEYINLFNEVAHYNNFKATQSLDLKKIDYRQLWIDKGWRPESD